MAFIIPNNNPPNPFPNAPRISITLPNLFKSFFAPTPTLHPDYRRAKRAAEYWMFDVLDIDGWPRDRLLSVDISYFTACWTYDAPFEKLRIICDWVQWVFPWDDLFDEGELSRDGRKANNAAWEVMDNMFFNRKVEEVRPREWTKTARLQRAHQDFWLRFRELASEEEREWYFEAMADLLKGEVEQVQTPAEEAPRSVEEILRLRRKSIGVVPTLPLLCFGQGIRIPKEVRQHEVVKRIERIVTDFTLIHNDVVSYRKEECESFTHNLVAVLRLQGHSAQAAMDEIGTILDRLLEEMATAEAALPSWGEQVDKEVAKYVRGCKDIAIGNLYWSFQTTRYLGDKREEVKRTRVMDVMEEPPYLVKKA